MELDRIGPQDYILNRTLANFDGIRQGLAKVEWEKTLASKGTSGK